MTSPSKLALIVSNNESSLNGLLALITTIPQISAVLVAEDQNLALRMIQNHQPALLILDICFPDMKDLIDEIKAHWAHIHLIVLVEDITQQKEVEALGVENVLLKGFSAQRLIEIAEKLLDPQGSASTIHTNQDGETKNETT